MPNPYRKNLEDLEMDQKTTEYLILDLHRDNAKLVALQTNEKY